MYSKTISIIVFLGALLTLTGCDYFTIETTSTTGIASTAEIANPASVFCKQNGNKLEIQTAADGSQSGVCVFPDGSTCEEWAYFRGECKVGDSLKKSEVTPTETPLPLSTEPVIDAKGGYMPPGTTEEISDWWGVIKSTPPGAQYDDYFERQDLGQVIYFGIDSLEPTVKSQIEALSDSGKIVHLYGTLFSNVPDYNGSQIQVNRIEGIDASGGYLPPGTSEEIADWEGIIKSTEPGIQYDDYFELWTNGQTIYFGIDSLDSAVQAQIKALRDSGKIVHLYGTVFSNVPDYNGSQVKVDRIEVVGFMAGSSTQPGTTEEISDWWGVIKSNPPGAQFDDYFERRDLSQTINYGIDSLDPIIQAKIKELRNSGKIVHLYGTLTSNVPDYNGSQILVDRIDVKE